MSSSLFLMFRAAEEQALLPSLVKAFSVRGFSFSETPQKRFINAPGEPTVSAQCCFYARNHFRIFVADLAIEIYHEASLPPDLAVGERQFLKEVLKLPGLNLRRWIVAEHGWDDEDNPSVQVLSEGQDRAGLYANQLASRN